MVTWGGKCGWLHGEVSVSGYMGRWVWVVIWEVHRCSDLGIWGDQCSGLIRWGGHYFGLFTLGQVFMGWFYMEVTV